MMLNMVQLTKGVVGKTLITLVLFTVGPLVYGQASGFNFTLAMVTRW